MRRTIVATAFAATLVTTAAFSQDGPLNRVGRALDNAGKNIRYRVESEVARGQVVSEEREVLGRVLRRIEWDKPMQGSALRLEGRPDGVVVLRGSVLTDEAKARAVDLATNTVGVTTVVDEIAVAKDVKVIETRPGATVIELEPAVVEQVEVVPPKVIVKP
jgi:hypothetical protein